MNVFKKIAAKLQAVNNKVAEANGFLLNEVFKPSAPGNQLIATAHFLVASAITVDWLAKSYQGYKKEGLVGVGKQYVAFSIKSYAYHTLSAPNTAEILTINIKQHERKLASEAREANKIVVRRTTDVSPVASTSDDAIAGSINEFYGEAVQ